MWWIGKDVEAVIVCFKFLFEHLFGWIVENYTHRIAWVADSHAKVGTDDPIDVKYVDQW
jgi:hypothetical protein